MSLIMCLGSVNETRGIVIFVHIYGLNLLIIWLLLHTHHFYSSHIIFWPYYSRLQ